MALRSLQADEWVARLSPAEASAVRDSVSAAATSLPGLHKTAGLDSGAVDKYLAMVTSPLYPPVASAGFVSGCVTGFVTGAGVWLKELEALFHLAGVGTMAGLTEFFARPLMEDSPQGLLPQTRQALDTLNSLRRLRPVFVWLSNVTPEDAVRTIRELIPTAGDLVEILGRVAGEWLTAEILTAPDPYASGEHIGRLVGRIILEIIRADVEPLEFIGIMAAAQLEMPDPEGEAP